MSRMKDPANGKLDVKALRDHVVGKEVASLEVFGINSLKTVDPPLSDLAGDVISDVHLLGGDVRGLQLELERHVVAIDLARTGVSVLLVDAVPWAPSGRSMPPTGRLILVDGTGG